MSRNQQFEASIHNPLSSRIGRRIVLIMVLVSGAITLCTTLLQLSWDYKEEFGMVDQRHSEIENVHSTLLATSLWSFDLDLLQQRINGLVNLPKIDYLKVSSEEYVFEAGEPITSKAISSQLPLLHQNPNTGETEHLGTIEVQSNAQDIYDHLIWQALYTLLLNSAKTFLVCLVMLMVFHKSVNQRIFSIAQYLRQYNPRHPSKPLSVQHYRGISGNCDEIDWLVDESNKITSNVTNLYQNIKHEQERLAEFAHVASDWLWETDAMGNLVYCSESMRDALGLESMSKPHISEIPILEQCQTLQSALKHQVDFKKVEETLTLNCINYYLLFQANARFENNSFVGYRGTTINITQLKVTQLKLEALNQNLEHTVASRTLDLKQSMEQLQKTQEQLVESEKLAALGGLVAGIAHEVNTPLGISVTATSVVQEIASELNQAFADQTLTSDQFASLMQRLSEASMMLEQNLNRAAKLIRDFKRTAVDQVSESRSQFNVQQVLDSLIASLHPETRKVPVTPLLTGDESIQINSLPGVLTQVASNLIMNSVHHAFTDQPNPQISIDITTQESLLVFQYKDNGSGIAPELHHKIFEPFYTTKRGRGGSGLGLNLVFNLVKQKLQGELEFDSEIGKGVHFTIRIPKDLPFIENDENEASVAENEADAKPNHTHDYHI